jgi:hypothetical protein
VNDSPIPVNANPSPEGAHGLCIETCAGTARLSAALAKWGIPTLSIDYDRNRHNSQMPIVKLDLTDPDAVAILLEPIEKGMVEVLTSAPPCGTASRARDIPIPGKLAPRPLRSEEWPGGLPDLCPEDKSRVEKANLVYDAVFILVRAMLQQGRSVLIENPLRSYLWNLPSYAWLLQNGCFDVVLQNCKFSVDLPSRAKWSRFRTNILEFRQLAGRCRLGHEHLSWGVKSDGSFATADEAAYPLALCFHMASVIADHLKSKGFEQFQLQDQSVVDQSDAHKKRRLLGFQQPRGNRLPSLISEFKEVITLPHNHSLEPDHKLLRYVAKGGDNDNDEQFMCPVVGVFRSPLEFVNEAVGLRHPIDMFETCDRHIFDSIVANLEVEPAATAKLRLASIRTLIKLSQDQKNENDLILDRMDLSAKQVYQGKNFALLNSLISKYKGVWPDSTIVDELIQGASLTGMHSHTGIFPFEVTLPQTSVENLRSNSLLHNRSMLTRTSTSKCPELDDQLWSQTLEEKEAGWLTGPFYSLQEVSDHINDIPHVSRRFPIQQGGKLRAIDDFHESNINLAYGFCDKLQLMDVDSIAASIRIIEHIVVDRPSVVKHPDGHLREIAIHDEWLTDNRLSQWQGAALDLKSAYKQIAIAPEQRWSNIISVFDPTTQQAALFVQNTLPFGATSSVMIFNRIARFLWFVGCKEFNAIWHNFYDDYPTLSPTILSKSTKSALELFMSLLGWKIACDDKKQMTFAEMFTALGVVFDVSDVGGLGAFINNTAKRKQQVLTDLRTIVTSKRLSQKQAESLVGKLHFMESQCFGRIGRSHLRCIRKFALVCSPVLESDCAAFLDLCSWLENSEPRSLTPKLPGTNLLFTDGACEFFKGQRKVTCGAILFPADGSRPKFFGFEVPQHISDTWSTEADKEQLVTEAELFPTLIAVKQWKDCFSHRRSLFFLDSEPAKHSLVRGTSNISTCAQIVKEFYVQVDSLKMFPWFVRAPSKSNPADAPSRLNFQECVDLFEAEICDVSHLL